VPPSLSKQVRGPANKVGLSPPFEIPFSPLPFLRVRSSTPVFFDQRSLSPPHGVVGGSCARFRHRLRTCLMLPFPTRNFASSPPFPSRSRFPWKHLFVPFPPAPFSLSPPDAGGFATVRWQRTFFFFTAACSERKSYSLFIGAFVPVRSLSPLFQVVRRPHLFPPCSGGMGVLLDVVLGGCRFFREFESEPPSFIFRAKFLFLRNRLIACPFLFSFFLLPPLTPLPPIF